MYALLSSLSKFQLKRILSYSRRSMESGRRISGQQYYCSWRYMMSHVVGMSKAHHKYRSVHHQYRCGNAVQTIIRQITVQMRYITFAASCSLHLMVDRVSQKSKTFDQHQNQNVLLHFQNFFRFE